MASFRRRLSRLERHGKDCPECGGSDFSEIEVVLEDLEGPEDGSGPEFCERCGRQTTFVVDWYDLRADALEDAEEPGRGEGVR